MAGTAKTALAAGLAKSTSAEAVVPVRLTGVAVPPPIGSATETVPSSITSRWTLFAASVALRPAVTISLGSVSAGALLGLLLWHPPRAKPSVAARTRTAGIRRDMRLLGVGVASATIRVTVTERVGVAAEGVKRPMARGCTLALHAGGHARWGTARQSSTGSTSTATT